MSATDTNTVSLQECYEAVTAVRRKYAVELKPATEKEKTISEIRAILCVVGVEYAE